MQLSHNAYRTFVPDQSNDPMNTSSGKKEYNIWNKYQNQQVDKAQTERQIRNTNDLEDKVKKSINLTKQDLKNAIFQSNKRYNSVQPPKSQDFHKIVNNQLNMQLFQRQHQEDRKHLSYQYLEPSIDINRESTKRYLKKNQQVIDETNKHLNRNEKDKSTFSNDKLVYKSNDSLRSAYQKKKTDSIELKDNNDHLRVSQQKKKTFTKELHKENISMLTPVMENINHLNISRRNSNASSQMSNASMKSEPPEVHISPKRLSISFLTKNNEMNKKLKESFGMKVDYQEDMPNAIKAPLGNFSLKLKENTANFFQKNAIKGVLGNKMSEQMSEKRSNSKTHDKMAFSTKVRETNKKIESNLRTNLLNNISSLKKKQLFNEKEVDVEKQEEVKMKYQNVSNVTRLVLKAKKKFMDLLKKSKENTVNQFRAKFFKHLKPPVFLKNTQDNIKQLKNKKIEIVRNEASPVKIRLV